jgi:hypothetical protein
MRSSVRLAFLMISVPSQDCTATGGLIDHHGNSAGCRYRAHENESHCVASCVGSVIEWYDFLFYAPAAALVFNKAFFPTFDPLAGTLAALGSQPGGRTGARFSRRFTRIRSQ